MTKKKDKFFHVEPLGPPFESDPSKVSLTCTGFSFDLLKWDGKTAIPTLPETIEFFQRFIAKLPDACPECGHTSTGSTWHRVFNTNLWNCMRCGNVIEESK